MAWIAERHAGWFLGWLAWAACAVTFVLFLASLSDLGRWARAAVAIGTAAAGIDLLADAIWSTAVPEVAATGNAAAFLTVERLAFVAGLVTANGLYATAVAVATLDLKGRALRPLVAAMAIGAAVLVVAGVRGSALLLELGTPPTMLAFIGWALLAAREAGAPATQGAPPVRA